MGSMRLDMWLGYSVLTRATRVRVLVAELRLGNIPGPSLALRASVPIFQCGQGCHEHHVDCWQPSFWFACLDERAVPLLLKGAESVLAPHPKLNVQIVHRDEHAGE